MARIFIAALFAVAGAIQLVWGYFSDKPLVPFISNWLQSKGVSPMNANIIMGLAFIVVAFLVFKFAKPKAAEKIESVENSKAKEQIKPVEISAEAIEDRSKFDVRYSCQILVRNIPQESRESLDVNLTDWNPLPANPYLSSGTMNLPMPTSFPILLKAKNDGTRSRPDEVYFELFKLIRASNIHTVEIIGRQTQFCPFQPKNTWQTFSIEVKSMSGILAKQIFKIKNYLDAKGIPTFDIEKTDKITP